MKPRSYIRPIKEGVIGSVLLLTVLFLLAFPFHLIDQDYDSLEIFQGKVTDMEYVRKSKKWKVTVENASDRRTFFLSRKRCADLDRKIDIGQYVVSKLYPRKYLLGNIHAAEISSPEKLLVPYVMEPLPSTYDLLRLGIIGFLGFTVTFSLAGIFNEYKNS